MTKRKIKSVKGVLCGAGMLAGLATIFSCTQAPGFKVEGHIQGARDTTLYFEALALDGVEVLDSVRLSADGAFQFVYSDTTRCPEFYRLRIGIGRPPQKGDVINWVLGRPCSEDADKIRTATDKALEVLEIFAKKGLAAAVRATRS